MKPSRSGPALLAAALLLGGLREPLAFAFGGLFLWLLVLRERPALGPARAWLPWLGWAFLSAVASAQPLAALPALARWSAALGFASLAASWDSDRRRDWLKAVGAAAVALAVGALFTGWWRSWDLATMTGLIPPYYNYSAFVLAAVAAGGAALALHGRAPRGARLAGAAAFAAGGFCVVLAHSRGACLGLAVAGAVWAVRRWGARAAFVLTVAALAGSGVWGGALLDKPGRRYPEVRPLIWRASAATASERPFLGEGPGSFSVGYRRHPVETPGGAARWGLYTDYAHSEPLQAAAETGWAGLALWLLGFGSALSVLFRRAQDEPAREAAAVAVAAMSVQLAVDDMLQIPGLAFLFFSAVAVADARSVGRRRWPAAAALAGCVLALTAWTPLALARGNVERAVALFPAESERREDAAYVEMNGGRTEEADANWRSAELLAPFNAIYPYQRARIAAARGRWADAESLARRALEREPDFADARLVRVEALWRLKRPAEARAELVALSAARAVGAGPSATAHYDEEIRRFDAAEFDRVNALAR